MEAKRGEACLIQGGVIYLLLPFIFVSLNRDKVPCCPQHWPMVLLLRLLLCFARETLPPVQKQVEPFLPKEISHGHASSVEISGVVSQTGIEGKLSTAGDVGWSSFVMRGEGSGLRRHRRPAQSGSLGFLGHSVSLKGS